MQIYATPCIACCLMHDALICQRVVTREYVNQPDDTCVVLRVPPQKGYTEEPPATDKGRQSYCQETASIIHVQQRATQKQCMHRFRIEMSRQQPVFVCMYVTSINCICTRLLILSV